MKSLINKIKYFLFVSFPLLAFTPNTVHADTGRNFAGFTIGKEGNLVFKMPNSPSEAFNTVEKGTTLLTEQNRIIGIVKILIQGIEGLVAIGMTGMFVVKAFMLVNAPDDTPIIKYKRAWEMVLCLVGIALSSGAWYITGIVFNALWGA